MTGPRQNPRARAWTKAIAVCGLLAAAVSPASRAHATALILEDTLRPEVDEAAQALSLILLGKNIPSVILAPAPAQDLGDLSIYSSVWDLRVDTPIPPQDVPRFTAFAQGGGGMFMMGENAGFAARNNSITLLLSNLGGGVVIQVSPVLNPAPGPTDIFEPTNPDHVLSSTCEAVTEVDYDGVANGQFVARGNGVWVTGTPATGAAAAWDVGQLVIAPNTRAVVVLDVNFMATGAAGTLDFQIVNRALPTQNRAFVQNMVTFLEFLDCCNNPIAPFAPAGEPRAPRAPAQPSSTCSS